MHMRVSGVGESNSGGRRVGGRRWLLRGSWRRRVAMAVAVAVASTAGDHGYGACITLAALASALKGHV